MKKILFVTNSLWNGGAQRVLLLLARGFADKAYDVKIISVNKVAKSYDDSLIVEFLGELGKTPSRKEKINGMRRAIKNYRPEVVISFEYFLNMETIIATRGLKVKVIVSERNDPAQQKDREFLNFMRNFLYKRADVLVCQTPDAKLYFPKKVQKHTVVIPNPIKSGLPLWHGAESDTIINFCRLEKQKNLRLLIDAFLLLHNNYPDSKLAIYGDGKERDNLIDYIAANNLSECVFIHWAIKEIHHIASSCRMFVSSSDYEGLSNSMLEAMAMGMPVICTDCPCGGARMVINDGENGLLVPVGDKESLYRAMKSVWEDRAFAVRLSNNAKKIVRELSEERILEKWNELL